MKDARSVLDELPLLNFLPPEVRKLVQSSFVPVSGTFGSLILREGEASDGLYVLVSGRARVIRAGPNGEEIPLNTLSPGDSFGEMGLLGPSGSLATVRASSDVELMKLDQSVFRALLQSNPEIQRYFDLQSKHRTLYVFFRLYSAFTRLPLEALSLMLSELETVSAEAGSLLIRQGEPPGPMYVVEEGRLRVYTEENGRRSYVGYLRKGDFFGEMSLFKNVKRAASVEALSACRLARLGRSTFEKLLEGYPDFKAKIEERIAQYDFKQVARVPLDFTEELLPAEASVQEKVGPQQVEQQQEAPALAADRLGPFASPEGHFVKGSKGIRRFPFVRQVDAADCGAACIAMVCRHFGRSVSLARIRQLVHTSTDGTSLKGLCRGATELGLAARSVKASQRNLLQMPLPAIVHWGGNHWIVLYHVDRRHAFVADPGIGLRKLRREEFDEKWTGYAALFDYTQEFEKAPESQPSTKWLWPFFRPFWGIVLKSFALAVIVSGLQMVLPIFTQVIVDKVLVERDVALLHMLILSMMAVLVFMTLATIVQRYLLSFVTMRVDAGTLDLLTRKLLALPMSYFNTRRTGDIQRRLAGAKQVREFLVQNGINGLMALVQLGTSLALMCVYSPVLTGVFLVTAPLYLLLMRFSARVLRPTFDSLEEAFGKYQSYQIDAIKGIETVKAMGAEGGWREKMLQEFQGLTRRQFRADFTILCYQGAIRMVTFLSTALFLWIGARQVMDGSLSIGGLVAFNSLVALANGPIGTFLSLWDSYQFTAVLLDRLNDLFECEPEQGADHSRLLPVRGLEGRVRFQNVGFQYGGPESPHILEGITLEVLPGKTVAIVGRSGSGKTTLIKCLASLLEPTEGSIFFDGIDMKTLSYRDLRQQIGFVLQENHLFDDTIARNIAFGEEQPDMDKVLWAARAANAHEFIERLPLGYETRVGEAGIAVSGGQRQRIAIARALYHRPAILIFDEATSALDTESERAVKQNMDQLLRGRTSFVIAHRLSTIRDADLILVLEKGRLAEQGTHEELMQRQGLYYYLCSQQLEL